MSRRILVFSGTTEGKNVALTLARRGWQVEMCVATEYGEKVLPEHAGVNVRVGRLCFCSIRWTGRCARATLRRKRV